MVTVLSNDTAFLHAHGIAVSPATLDKQLTAAVSQLQRTLYGESRDELTEPELRVLETGGFDLNSREQEGADPLALAAAEYAALLKTSLTTATVAAKLGVDQSRIRQRLAERTLYGFRQESHWLIPAFQFAQDQLLPGIGTVVSQLDPELHPVTVMRWFLTPQPDLYVEAIDRMLSPRDWLRLGYPTEPLAQLAARL
jgi:hypothetical protein